jgi:hypothetical protein
MALVTGSNDGDFLTGTAEADIILGWLPDNPPGDDGPATDSDVIDGLGGNDSLSAAAAPATTI